MKNEKIAIERNIYDTKEDSLLLVWRERKAGGR